MSAPVDAAVDKWLEFNRVWTDIGFGPVRLLEPVLWRDGILQMLGPSMSGLPSNFILRPELVFAPRMFWWLEKPLEFIHRYRSTDHYFNPDPSDVGELRFALGDFWEKEEEFDQEGTMDVREEGNEVSALVVQLVESTLYLVVLTEWTGKVKEWDRNAPLPGELTPTLRLGWRLGETQAQAVERFLVEEHAPRFPEATLLHTRYARYVAELFTRLTAVSLLFTEQRLLTFRQERASRATRKRVQRFGLEEGKYHVVALRRYERHEHDAGDDGAANWAYRWLVRGHWRQQWYPSLSTNQPLWVSPHIKGPAHLPVKAPNPRVFDVRR